MVNKNTTQKIDKNNILLDKKLNREIKILFKDALKTIFKQPALGEIFSADLQMAEKGRVFKA